MRENKDEPHETEKYRRQLRTDDGT